MKYNFTYVLNSINAQSREAYEVQRANGRVNIYKKCLGGCVETVAYGLTGKEASQVLWAIDRYIELDNKLCFSIQQIDRKLADELFATEKDGQYKFLGKYILEEDGKFIGIDNENGFAWTEEFDTRRSCERWLFGEIDD